MLTLCLAASGFGLLLVFSATRYLHTNRYVLVQAAAILMRFAQSMAQESF